MEHTYSCDGILSRMAGLKPDGSVKIRPIDDLTRSGCNLATAPSEKLRYESLDLLLRVSV